MMNLMQIQDTDFSGYTLIIPSVSVGNVPQLTVDLLITTYDLKKLSTIWHPAIISSVGSDPYYSDTSKIYTSCELYVNEEFKLAAIQLRSTIDNKLALNFFNDLRDMIVTFKFKDTFILSSAFDYELHNMLTEKFYFLSSTGESDTMECNNVKPLEVNINGKFYLNGGGFGIKLYQILHENVPCTLLIKYVSEGDNRPDAIIMLRKLFAVMRSATSTSKNFKSPSSWQFVFGGPPPLGIY